MIDKRNIRDINAIARQHLKKAKRKRKLKPVSSKPALPGGSGESTASEGSSS